MVADKKEGHTGVKAPKRLGHEKSSKKPTNDVTNSIEAKLSEPHADDNDWTVLTKYTLGFISYIK